MSNNKNDNEKKNGNLLDRIEDAVFTVSIDNQDPVYNAKKEVLVPYINTATDVPDVKEGKSEHSKPREKKKHAVSESTQNDNHNIKKEALGPNAKR
ncbi:MAG: hypothetical protein CVU97_05150 [Firmicutes bacterium HGW-Firmicutes-21]|nr:MAG: hypothetical protein CVU97_05150 [Firmicutes bacterium HGW-Firmicutes-21]